MLTGKGKGAHSTHMRDINERHILAALRRLREATISDLSDETGTLANTVWRIVEDLSSRALVREVGRRSGGRGMPATIFRLDPDGAFSFGHFVGRDRVETAIMDFSGTIRAATTSPVPYPLPDPTLDLLSRQREQMVAEISRSLGRPLSGTVGTGLAIPNNLGGWSRELVVPAEAAVWADVSFPDMLSERVGHAVIVENDGNAAAVGELFQGVGHEIDSFLYLFIGPSTGGGMIAEGRPLLGSTGTAGDFGLMPVPPSRLPSGTPSTGPFQILTATASLAALLRWLRHEGMDVAFDSLDAAVDARPDLLEAWIDDAMAGLVPALLTSICLADPQAIVVGGNAPATVLDRLRDRLAATLTRVAPEGRAIPPVMAGAVGGNAPVFGAAALPLYRAYGKI